MSDQPSSNGNSTPPPQIVANDGVAHRCAIIVPTTQTIIYSLTRWLFDQLRDGPSFTVSILQHMSSGYVEDMRQALTEGFLRQCDAPWLLMIDSDTLPRLSARQIVDGAEAAGVKIVAGPTPVHGKAGGVYSNLTSLNDTAMIGTRWHKIPWEQKERYWPIRAAGFACTLIHRDVIATLMDDAKAGRAAWPFRAGWRNGRMLQSEDFSFFLRAYKRGFRAYADLDNPCSHVKHIALTPSRAIEDLVFHDPTAQPHPQAPRDLPEGWAVAEFVGSGLNKPRLVVPAGAEPAPPAAPAKE